MNSVTTLTSVDFKAKITLKPVNYVVHSTPTKNLKSVDYNGNEFQAPDFKINDILKVIPKECYDSSLLHSLGVVLRDISLMLLFGYIAETYVPQIESKTGRFIGWSIYVNLMALPMTGLWILAHECGHGAFSKYQKLNDFIGLILHSYSLNPYFSWKYSHKKHHKYNGNLRKDMAFVPPTLKEWKQKRNIVKLSEIVEDAPINSIYTLLIQQIVGFQTYLLTDATGQTHPDLENKWYGNFFASHFNPIAPIFEARDFWFIVLSDLGILTQLTLVSYWIKNFGWFNCMVHWFIPYLLVNHWIVFITFLQHTDATVPRYDLNEWTFVRGAGATIDRDFGFVGWFFFHDLIETHVLHHYSARIPFYNARIATKEIKKVLGKHYNYSNENMFVMLWKAVRQCEFVQGDNGIFMFRNHNGFGIAPIDE
jgi:omega-6 fatty acid desaturase (delta-12 desaturase)